MNDPTIITKISEFFNNSLLSALRAPFDLILEGDLHQGEHLIMNSVLSLHDYILGLLLPAAARRYNEDHEAPQGCSQRLRPHSICLCTGTTVEVCSPYYHRVSADYNQGRRPLLGHWNIVGQASPLLCDRTAFMAMIAPSYELANQGLKKFSVDICTSSTRKITTLLADRCNEVGEQNLIVPKGFTLADKRVVISLDGGRSRLREYTGELNERGNPRYATPWREPKLFVIDILDKEGRPDRHELPIYGCRFAEHDVLENLRTYLHKFHIGQAQQVQLIADGATWIWKEVPDLLTGLGVTKNNLVQTLDYYHASHYAHEVVKNMPRRISQKKRAELLNSFKSLLDKGNPAKVVEEIVSVYKRPGEIIKRYINYLRKHIERMQYAHYKELGLMCGSGIIESAVRRIINLRFKNSSTFWNQPSLEKLYFLRGALLSKRWDIVMNNLFKPA
ncbi:MAG: hypothetical protein AAGF87_18820 [Bacteroidota bacterium]